MIVNMGGFKYYIFWTCFSVVVLSYLFSTTLPHNMANKRELEFVIPFIRLIYFYPVYWLGFIDADWQISYSEATLGGMLRICSFLNLRQSEMNLKVVDTHFSHVPVRLYIPVGPQKPEGSGALFYFHGGGFVLFDVQSFDMLTRELASQLNVLVISVDYRRAPSHTFPTALNDCEFAVVHFMEQLAEQYMVDVRKIAVAGDSAGGNLAAGVALRLRKHTHLPKLKAQVLIYPVIQFHDFRLPSYQKYYREYANTGFLDPRTLVVWLLTYLNLQRTVHIEQLLNNEHHTTDLLRSFKFRRLRHDFLPNSYRESALKFVPDVAKINMSLYSTLEPYIFNPEFSPIMSEDLSGLPSAYVMTCEYDILRDEGYFYAKQLEAAGVPTVYKHYEQGYHAMLNMHPFIPLAKRAILDIVMFLKKMV